MRTVKATVLLILCSAVFMAGCSFLPGYRKELCERQVFRDSSLEFIRSEAASLRAGEKTEFTKTLPADGACALVVVFYLDGERKASGKAMGEVYSDTLAEAVRDLYEKGELGRLSEKDFLRGRFYAAVMFEDGRRISFVEYDGKGLEMTGKVTAVRHVDSEVISANIKEGKEYLLRMLDPKLHGIFKRYDAVLEEHDGRLRTIFTSSTLYTLLKMNDISPDPRIEKLVPLISSFILSMQKEDEPFKGAFHYAYRMDTAEREDELVVGTASKTIFTLLELYRRTGIETYLSSAVSAGEWLLTMIGDDGVIVNSVTKISGEWVEEIRFSYLYAGQCLSAFSRLYTVTGDKRYLEKAGIIAEIFIANSRAESYFVSDGWRSNFDPVPTSWVMMALLDYFKVTGDERARETIFRSAKVLIERQENNPRDIRDYGRYHATATSGSGWIAEVLSEIYRYGMEKNWPEVREYKDSIIKAARWIIQNTYSPQNTFFIRNAENVYGGPIHQYNDDAVRTDAVCHGVNGYLNLLPYLTEEDVLDVPEKEMYTREGCRKFSVQKGKI